MRTTAARSRYHEMLVQRLPVILALSGLAITQPLLDLFGQNPEYFVSSHLTRAQIITFALVVTFAVPLVAAVIEFVAFTIGSRWGRVVHSGLVGMLSFVFGLTLARHFSLDRTLLAAGASLVLAVTVVVAERRVAPVQLGLRYLAVAPLLFLGFFLVGSESSRVLWSSDAELATDVTVGNPAPVVVIQLDELPVASLMRPDGTINAERFPNFARLAASTTWFRNATSNAPRTSDSVPGALTGLFPEPGQIPSSVDHPRNLFTLIGAKYELNVTEPVAQLCPATVCGATVVQTQSASANLLRSNLVDAGVVLGHLSLPQAWRTRLPALEGRWNGFGQSSTSGPAGSGPPTTLPASVPSSPTPLDFVRHREAIARLRFSTDAGAILEDRIASIGPADRSVLYYAHETFPHFSWRVNQRGREYHRGIGLPDGLGDDFTWHDDFLARQGLQRHLLQVGWADHVIGELIDRLEAEGIWDKAVVVVLADHGVAFTPGEPFREATERNQHEIFSVPLFIHRPGQQGGEVRNDNAMIVDVLPTIVDLLDVHTTWEFDGRSLFGDDPPPATKPVFVTAREPDAPTQVTNAYRGLLAVVRRNERLLPYGHEWLSVYQVGANGGLVGREADNLDVAPLAGATWALDHPEEFQDVDVRAGVLPVMESGNLRLAQGQAPPDELLVVMNGRVAGIGGDLKRQDDGTYGFSVLVAPEFLRDGANDLKLLVPLGAGGSTPFGRAAGP